VRSTVSAPFDWPHANVAAASFTFDVDAESPWIAMDPENQFRPGVLSQATYGPRVGVPLILDVLEKHGVKGTFFIPGINAELYPDTVEMIVKGGHELAIHGYTHRSPSSLSLKEESEELDKAFDLLSAAAGRIAGYRSPSWDVSPNTLELLEAKGILYASEFMDDLRPYRHPGRQLIELPIHWMLDDFPHFAWYAGEPARTIRNTEEVEFLWKEEFDGICAQKGSFILTLHPQISGRPSRVALLDRMLEYVCGRGDVWVATCLEIAEHAADHLPQMQST
jgi:peptidoglycan-N-acetylglucosamine deacetylase